MDNKNQARYLTEFSYLTRKRAPGWAYTLPQDTYVSNMVSLYDQYLPKKNNLNPFQKNVLNDILNSLKSIDDSLEPFRKHGIKYNLGVTGGAVYDLVTNNSQYTKDIDIVLNFEVHNLGDLPVANELHQEFLLPLNKVMQQFDYNIPNKEYVIYEQDGKKTKVKNYTMEDLSHLVTYILSQTFSLNQQFHAKDFEKKEYCHKFLFSLLKLNHEKSTKPIDLMIALSPIEQYSKSFDFDICKGYIHYRRKLQEDIYMGDFLIFEGNNPPDFAMLMKNKTLQSTDLLDHLYMPPCMLQDLDQKNLTMLVSSFEEENVHFYMEHHYPRLKAKLPDYKLNFRSYNDKNKEVAACYIFNERIAKPHNIAKIHKINI
jgi:hypothetical protein